METMEIPRQIQTQQPGFGFDRCGFCFSYLPRSAFHIYEKEKQLYRACSDCSGSDKMAGYRKVR